MANMINLTINEQDICVEEGTTLLDAARKASIDIPTLCFMKSLNDISSCRVCMVEVEGEEQLAAACSTLALEGMRVLTNGPRARRVRKTNIELLLSQHDVKCTSCVRADNCELHSVAAELNITDIRFETKVKKDTWPSDFPLIRDEGKCIKCLRCIQICEKVQASGIWAQKNRATHSTVGVANALPIEESLCVLCGQCITHCPVSALRERDDTDRVFEALACPDTTTVIQIAPAVRAAWGESLGLSHEEATVGRLVAALRKVGFDYIFDTDFTADLTIMEEGSELLARLGQKDATPWPMFTSCCPGWVRYLKGHHADMTDNLSTAKSPQQMFGAVAKTWFAEKSELDPKNTFVVSIMPCLAKKHECALAPMNDAGAGPDVDVVLTTREVDRLIKAALIDVASLEGEEFDSPLGTASGAGVIFGATGGVMEAALRSAYFLVTGSNPDPDAFAEVRGRQEGWKEAVFDLAGTPLRIAIASGLENAEQLLQAIKAGKVHYDFVEIMACPGGCVGGGGQPISGAVSQTEVRSNVLYGLDSKNSLRFSHENPVIAACYEEYFEAPLSEKSHHLLHTDHHAWSMPPEK